MVGIIWGKAMKICLSQSAFDNTYMIVHFEGWLATT